MTYVDAIVSFIFALGLVVVFMAIVVGFVYCGRWLDHRGGEE